MSFEDIKAQAAQDIILKLGSSAQYIPFDGGAVEDVTVFLNISTQLEPSPKMEALVPVPTPTISVIESVLSKRPVRFDRFKIISTGVYYTVQAIVNDNGNILTIAVST